MKLTLPSFGLDEMEIDPSTLIEFPNGLHGLEGCKHFKLFHAGDNPSIFWLQSIDDLDVALSLTDPDALNILYDITLTDDELSALQVDASDELQIAVVLAGEVTNDVTVPAKVRANFRTPIIINVSKRVALQRALHDSELSLGSYRPKSDLPLDVNPATPGFHEVSSMGASAKDNLCAFAA